MQSHEDRVGMKVCIAGAGGYIGSWLVKLLLQLGYTVHATLRNPKNDAQTGPMLSLPGDAERLKLFQAELSEDGSFDSAVEGCEGVCHVASTTDFSKTSEKVEIVEQDDFVPPALQGVLNVLKSCSRAKSVKRVVYSSSVAAACPLNDEGGLINGSSLDESIWTPVDFMRRKSQPSNFYCLSKTLAEKAVIDYGLNSDQMDVVTIGSGYVAGRGIISSFPYSCGEISSPITGDYEALKLSESFLGSIPLVHINDLCEAHIFLMEQPNFPSQHICCVSSFTVSELANFIHERYPHLTLQFKGDGEDDNGFLVPVSSMKLLNMGFFYKHGVEDIYDETIKWAQSCGLLK